MNGHLAYGLAWIAFGLSHSALAGRHLAGRWSRIVYNVIAVAAFLALGAVGGRALGAEPVFDLPLWARWGMGGVHVAGWAVMLYAARFYDLGRLGGLAQLRQPESPEDESLRLDGPHAWVRHPLYAGAFLILWGAAPSPLGLATAIWGSLYLLVGTACEERRLLARYGEDYAAYRARVPAFVPWRGRAALSADAKS
ncbi:putative conserved integral membrane protein [Paramagnetospirillum magnetotacticum MS-1]|uniref:Putative conserved integral membrane protein n=1 Tax=Paramagnetospirillum magnetotacticum MS-1 TaxID=272627 RepID=A0A0C2YC07_PARME|nr:isoprenylcysteine carboxylmethyltransferase family protein [Paramagnetospirillum magnetotacticum]KIL97289.1 putative conserved integral membrane protein [Paramagnetospirillum magnetotacticum MS-1]